MTFSAQDMTTGVLSAGVAATLVKDVTTYVDVAPCVLIGAGSAPRIGVAVCLGVKRDDRFAGAGMHLLAFRVWSVV